MKQGFVFAGIKILWLAYHPNYCRFFLCSLINAHSQMNPSQVWLQSILDSYDFICIAFVLKMSFILTYFPFWYMFHTMTLINNSTHGNRGYLHLQADNYLGYLGHHHFGPESKDDSMLVYLYPLVFQLSFPIVNLLALFLVSKSYLSYLCR